jgi:hypothetical protein
VLESLKLHPDLSILAKNAIECLTFMAGVDQETFEFIRVSSPAVP